MWPFVCISCLLLASNIHTSVAKDEVDPKVIRKAAFNLYYEMKGVRNASTDKIVEDFFEHKFKAYPVAVYPAFEEIFLHISKANSRIWKLYESVLYLYRNVAAADKIYKTVLNKFSRGQSISESEILGVDSDLPVDEKSESEFAIIDDRSGVIPGKEEPDSDWQEPCSDECGIPPLQIGSIRATPGVHFPNYNDIPITSFKCAGRHIPGFYADLETGCQVFHVCYPHRRESFLCPVGTTFNQAILACDYWYSSNCSLAPLYFKSGQISEYEVGGSVVDDLLGHHPKTPTEKPDHPTRPGQPKIQITLPNIDWALMIKFLPIKSKVTECPDYCGTTTSSPVKTTASTVSEYTKIASTRPVVTPTVATLPPKKTRPTVKPTPTVVTVPPKKDEKTAKPEILLNILKAVEVLTKDAEEFLTKIMEKKRQHPEVSTKKPTVPPRRPTGKPKPFPEINPKFIVKPAKYVKRLPRPTVSRSKSMKPSKQILKSKMEDLVRQKEPAKLVLEGLKAIESLFQ